MKSHNTYIRNVCRNVYQSKHSGNFPPFFSFSVTARDNREMRQYIIACTLRVLRLAGCSVICDLTSWYPSLTEVLREKNYVPMKSDTRFILFDWLGHNNSLCYSIAICDVWERYSEALWNYFLQAPPGKPQNMPRSIRWRIEWSIIQQQAQQHKYLGLKEAKINLNNSE